VQLFRDGTDGLGYLLKASIGDLGDLLHALREVTCGRSVVDGRVVEQLVEQRIRQAESPLSRQAPRELEILKEMAEGKTNAAIGEGLHLSESAGRLWIVFPARLPRFWLVTGVVSGAWVPA